MSETLDKSTFDAPDIYASCVLLSTALDDDSMSSQFNLMATSPTGLMYVPPCLDEQTNLDEIPWQLVRAALWQFYANLLLMCESEDHELVHQARIGWRRLRGTYRLIRTIPHLPTPPSTEPLQILMEQLRALRECHVARYEILPLVTSDHQEWCAFAAALEMEALVRHKVLRILLQDPSIGNALWQQVVWLMHLKDYANLSGANPINRVSPTQWATQHVVRIQHQFERAHKKAKDPETLHQARIWAKRLRYAVEDLKGMLPHKAMRWHRSAIKAQSKLGAKRDVEITAELARRHGAPHIAKKILSISSAN